jgi:capsular polysaccharide biosynthesis protein
MNIRKSLILSLTVAAFAMPGISSATDATLQSTNTRAEVIHTLEVARQDGSLVNNVSRSDSIAQKSSGSANTRAQVVAELQAARLNGTLVNNIENTYGTTQKFAATNETRMQVKRELVMARAHGHNDSNISRN